MAPRVLVLDDSRAARQFFCRVLRESGLDVGPIEEASDLASARRLLGLGVTAVTPPQPPFGLVMLDAELPDGSAAQLLAELAPYDTRKVLATIHGDDEHLRTALRLGADGYLLKEDPSEIWVDELRRLDRGRPALSPSIVRRLMNGFAGDAALPAPATSPPQAAAMLEDFDRLTPRENEVLTYLSKGFTIREISGLLGIRWFTVNDHIKAIYRKLDVSSRAEAAVLAAKQGLV